MATDASPGTDMKLVIAVVQDEDADRLIDALVQQQFRVTRISSSGGLLRLGSTSLMCGAPAGDVPTAVGIIRQACKRRRQMILPYAPTLEPGFLYLPENTEVEVGGAIVFVLNVDRFVRI